VFAIADEPVESGQCYVVIAVDGHPPDGLDNFTGDIHLTLTRNGRDMQVVGSGTRTPDAVRFYQKDVGLHQRDLRVWVITDAGGRSFHAEPYAAF
jgi:hypothetical protein